MKESAKGRFFENIFAPLEIFYNIELRFFVFRFNEIIESDISDISEINAIIENNQQVGNF